MEKAIAEMDRIFAPGNNGNIFNEAYWKEIWGIIRSKLSECQKPFTNNDYAAALSLVERWELGNNMGAGIKITFKEWLKLQKEKEAR